MKIIAVKRDPRFSPNAVEKDKAILEAVAERMRPYGEVIYTDEVSGLPEAFAAASDTLVLSMARLPETLVFLKEKEKEGAVVVNCPQGVENCTRSRLDAIMRENHIPMPPAEGEHGYWVKRGDGAAQSARDVVFAADRTEAEAVRRELGGRGITQVVVSAHVEGDLVKFYGVSGTDFFRCYYPTEDGETKFDNELHNGKAHFYPFQQDELRETAEHLARLTGVDVYGGDCIVTADGNFKIIDFNDWPGFSRCKEEAAEAIVEMIGARISQNSQPDSVNSANQDLPPSPPLLKEDGETSAKAPHSFKELLRASFKSDETEEWLDVHFTRPIGLVFALLWNKLGIHPNAITILSIFLGVGAAVMFYFTDLWHNIAGVILLMFANFCDSTDGQMARLTGKKTLIGRMLDGFSGDVWFFAIYFAICMRLMPQLMPYTDIKWGVWIWLLAAISGFLCHSPQSSLADYYRQIHLLFLKGKNGSELDTYERQREILQSLPKKGAFWDRAFYYNYANYCKSQEHRTPSFQAFHKAIREKHGEVENVPETLRQEFLAGSRPLMKYTNILTFNVRAICIYATCLLNCPWLYLLIEIVVMSFLYVYMHKQHEHLCRRLTTKI